LPSASRRVKGQSCRPASEPRFELSRLDLPLELSPDCLGVFPGVGLRYEPVTDSVAAIEALVVANQHGDGSGRVESKQQGVSHGREFKGLSIQPGAAA
jgi:hypothetical protein